MQAELQRLGLREDKAGAASDVDLLVDILSVLDRAPGFPIPDRRGLESTDYLQDAVIRCLEVIGEAAKCLSKDCRDRYPAVPWRGMARLQSSCAQRVSPGSPAKATCD
ncbi:MAG: HepT-like ribonuclease domain-containing protein [Synechococcaceae cyanobacterium]